MCCSSSGTVEGRVRSLSDTWEKRETGLQTVGGREEAAFMVRRGVGSRRNCGKG